MLIENSHADKILTCRTLGWNQKQKVWSLPHKIKTCRQVLTRQIVYGTKQIQNFLSVHMLMGQLAV